jgi:hypothetical protein
MTRRSHLALLALAGALTLGESNLLATTVTVGADPSCQFTSLEAAVSAIANDPDPNPTIRVAAGLHQAVRVTIDRSVTIEGGYSSCLAAAPDSAFRSILDAGRDGRAITVTGPLGTPIQVRLVNLSLENGLADLGGGLSVTGRAQVTLENMLVLGNEATVGGGGIHFDGPSDAWVMVLASGVNGNEAPMGGGILCRGSGFLVGGSNSGIGGNRATTLGGGIRASGCEVVLEGPMTVSANAAAHGGGIFLDSSAEAELRGNPDGPLEIRQNRATSGGSSGGTGGGIAVSGETTHLSLHNVTLERNRALHSNGGGGEGGGLMVADHGRAFVLGGPGLFFKATSGELGSEPVPRCPEAMSCSRFEDNEAGRGAAVQVGFAGRVSLINTEIVGNQGTESIVSTAARSGGSVLLEGSYLHRNLAPALIRVDGDSLLRVIHVTAAANLELEHAIRTTRSDDSSPEVRLRNDLFADPVPVLEPAPGGVVTTECLFVANASGLGEFPGIFTEDPQLVDPSAGDLHLGPNSPAVDRCFQRHELASVDSENDERGVVADPGLYGDVGGFDAGADELGRGTIFADGFESGTLSAWDVGP